jgi:hypothetical protein
MADKDSLTNSASLSTSTDSMANVEPEFPVASEPDAATVSHDGEVTMTSPGSSGSILLPAPPPVTDLPPPPTDASQAAAYDPGILMLLGVIQSANKKTDERFANLRAEVTEEIDEVHNRIDAVEDDLTKTSSVTAVCVKKISVIENQPSARYRRCCQIN